MFPIRPATAFGKSVPVLSAQDVKRTGYGTGWYTDAACENEFDDVMPAENTTVYAGWEAGTAGYTVKHYQENANDSGVHAE